jgi:hypothetical protein
LGLYGLMIFVPIIRDDGVVWRNWSCCEYTSNSHDLCYCFGWASCGGSALSPFLAERWPAV